MDFLTVFAIREAAEETGFIEKVPVLDAAGKPTGQYEYRFGEEGEKGYLKWLATNQPAQFASLYGRLVPREVNQKSEQKTVVRYETIEERRQAMIAKRMVAHGVGGAGGGDGGGDEAKISPGAKEKRRGQSGTAGAGHRPRHPRSSFRRPRCDRAEISRVQETGPGAVKLTDGARPAGWA